MLPIILTSHAHVGLIGKGDALERRSAMLAASGIHPAVLSLDVGDDVLEHLHALFIAGLDSQESEKFFIKTRALSVLLNVEDTPEFCDFHVPAIVRRGDFMLTASTGGQAPGLSRQLRERLETQYGPEWAERVTHVHTARQGWQADGLPPAQVSQRMRAFVAERGWL